MLRLIEQCLVGECSEVFGVEVVLILDGLVEYIVLLLDVCGDVEMGGLLVVSEGCFVYRPEPCARTMLSEAGGVFGGASWLSC